MSKTIGFGSILTVATTTGIARIGQVRSLSGPGSVANDVDTTTFDSSCNFRTYIPGVIDSGEFTAELVYDPANSMHKRLAYYMGHRSTKIFQVYHASSTGQVDEFSAYVKGITREIPMDELIMASVTMKVTGAPGYSELELTPDLAFDAAYGLLDASSGTVEDGEAVTDWNSKVGSVALSQATVAKKPMYLFNGIGNKPGIIFDGGDYMPGSAVPIKDATVGAVMIAFQQAVTTGEQCMLSVYNNSVSTEVVSFSLLNGKLMLVHQSGPGQPVGLVVCDSDVGTGCRVATFMCRQDVPGGWEIYLDGIKQVLTPSYAGNIGKWFGGVPSIDTLTVGCERGAGASAYKGQISYIGIWNTKL